MDDQSFFAWLAGFWEGEGSFRVRLRPNGTLRSAEVTIWQSNKEVLERIQKRLGFGSVHLHRKGRSPTIADGYYMVIYGILRIQRFFFLITPYLLFTQEYVEKNLKLLEGRKSKLKQPLGFEY